MCVVGRAVNCRVTGSTHVKLSFDKTLETPLVAPSCAPVQPQWGPIKHTKITKRESSFVVVRNTQEKEKGQWKGRKVYEKRKERLKEKNEENGKV